MNIDGRTAFVTGAAVGTGRAITLALAGRGPRVIAADVDDDRGAVRFAHLDVTDREALAALIRDTAPTVLVNNAGG